VIEAMVQDVPMIGFVIVLLLVIVGPLAVVAGVDSRVDDVSRRRLGH
jgi:hypothetical protein